MHARRAGEHGMPITDFVVTEIERDGDARALARGDQGAQLGQAIEARAELFDQAHADSPVV